MASPVAVVLVVLGLFSLTSSTLFGVQSGNLAQGFQIASINLQNGKQTPVGSDFASDLNLYQQIDLDTKNNILYALLSDTSDGKLYLGGFQLPAVTQTTMIALPFSQGTFLGIGQNIDFNPNTGEILVCGADPAVNGSHHLISVNPKSAAMRSIAVISQDIKLSEAGAPSTFDYINNVWWSELVQDGGTTIVRISINISTGVINIVPNTCNMQEMHFDPKTGLIFGMGVFIDYQKKTFHRTLCALNSKTGEDKKVADFLQYGFMWSSTSALDLSTRQLYALLAPTGKGFPWNLVSVNVDTLKLTQGPILDNTATCNDCPVSLFIA